MLWPTPAECLVATAQHVADVLERGARAVPLGRGGGAVRTAGRETGRGLGAAGEAWALAGARGGIDPQGVQDAPGVVLSSADEAGELEEGEFTEDEAAQRFGRDVRDVTGHGGRG